MIIPITEGEAKNKQCPHKPMVYAVPGSAGEPVPSWTNFDACSGSRCMSWSRRPDGKGWCGMISAPKAHIKNDDLSELGKEIKND